MGDNLTYGTGIDTSGFLSGLARMKSLGHKAGEDIAKSLTVRPRDAKGRFAPGVANIGGLAMPKFSMPKIALPSISMPKIGGIGNSVAAMAGSAKSLVSPAFGGLAAGALGGMGAANVVSSAVDMEKRIIGLGKAADLTGDDLAKMKSGLFELSTSMSGIALTDMIDIATQGAKMGVASDDLLKFVSSMSRVSAAVDDMPAGEIADRLGGINATFKLPIAGLEQMGSAIDRLADSGQSSFAGVVNVMSRIAGAGATAKLSAQETAALATTLLDTKTSSELAAGTLSHLILQLNDKDSAAGFAKTIGVSTDQFAAAVKGKPITAIESFLGALARMDSGTSRMAIESVGIKGIEQIAEVQKLAAVSGNLTKYVGFANEEFRTLNQATKSYEMTAASTGAKMTVFDNQMLILKDTIGSKFLPTINSSLATLGTFSGRLGGLFDRVEGGLAPVMGPLREFGETLAGAFKSGVAGMMSFLPSFSTVAGMIRSGLATIGPAISSTIGYVTSAIGYIRGLPASIDATFGDGMAAKIGTFAATFGAVAAGVALAAPVITAAIGLAGSAIAGTLAVISSGPVLVGGLAAGIMALSGTTMSFGDIISLAGFGIRNFGSLGQLAFLKVGAFAANLIDNIALIPANFMAIAKFVGSNWLELMLTPLSIIGEGIRGVASAFWKFLQDPTGGFSLDLSGMYQEIESFKRTLATAPAMAIAKPLDISAQTDAIYKQINEREAAFNKTSLPTPAPAPISGLATLPPPPTPMAEPAIAKVATPTKVKREFYANSGRMKPLGGPAFAKISGPAGQPKPEFYANSGRRKPMTGVAAGMIGPPVIAKGSDPSTLPGSQKAMIDTPRFAGAAALGSTEAYKTIAAATTGRGATRGDGMTKAQIAHTKAQKDGNKVLKGIRDDLRKLDPLQTAQL